MVNGFVDLHSHILPGVDDGSRNIEETIRMLGIAYAEGITTIIATPHYMAGAKNIPAEQLRSLCNEVQKEAMKINPNMRILPGNEIYYSESVLEAIKAGEALTLADSRYILVEFSPREAFNNMFRGLSGMISAGYLPIVAHIERYGCLHRNRTKVEELINLGCYLQMNGSSLIGGLLDSNAKYHRKLVDQGLIHFLGSDCHDDKVRVPMMARAWKQLHKKCDEEVLNRIFNENPFKVLENTYI